MASFLTDSVLVDIPSSQRFDEARLLQYLRRNIDIFPKSGPLKVLKFGYGQSNPAYLLQCNGIKLVLKKKPSGSLAKSAHLIEREYRVMNALQNTHVPVPKTYNLCTDSSIIGTTFYICEFIKGRIFTKASLPSLDPQKRFAIYAEANRVLSAIHSVNLTEVGLHNFSKSKTEHIQRIINISNAQFMSTQTVETAKIDELNKLYSKIIKYERKDIYKNIVSLVHGDYKFDNIIFDEKSLRILAVLDWELSTIGNPLYDLVYFCSIYHSPNTKSQVRSGLIGINLSKYGIPNELSFIRGWIQGLNIKTSAFIKNFTFPIKDYNFYLALSTFRGIGIFQGIVNRIKQGNASNPTKWLPKGIPPNVLLKLMAIHALKYLNQSDVYQQLLIIPKAVLSKNEADHLPRYLEPFRQYFKNSAFFDLRRKLLYFMESYIYPAESQHKIFYLNPLNSGKNWNGLEILKLKAKELGLWNLFLPKEYEESGGLTNLQYAPLAEIMGRSPTLAPEACNCSAPDTGNMEVLAKYGTKMQKEKYLKPLLDGRIRSSFCMTEPAVASSDASNIECSIIKSSDGKYYILNGRKHWITGAMDPRCKLYIVMGKIIGNTDINNMKTKYKQHSMLIVPSNLRGIRIIRHLKVFGYDDIEPPHGHAEIIFNNVKVATENLILGEGKGFEISQNRLGSGRIHHCMRIIGMSERALNLMKKRSLTRYAFGRMIGKFTSIQQDISDSRCDIEQTRLLVLQTAAMMDRILGNKKARQYISMIKVVAPQMAMKVIDRAIQVYGGLGVSQDTILPQLYSLCRCIHIADGPGEVHQRVVARLELLDSKL